VNASVKEEEKMNIVYWSDYACPFCYIGETRMNKAISELENEHGIAKGQVTATMKAFQLDPTAGTHAASDTVTRFAHKYGLSMEDAAAQIDTISAMGRAEGLDFRYATTLFTNTMDAHRLTKLAQHKGTPEQTYALMESLMKAYFTDNKELADHALLQKLGEEAGLNAEDVKNVLDSDLYRDEVEADEREAYSYGISGVPFFIIAGKYGINGAQSTEGIKAVILKAVSEDAHEKKKADDAAAAAAAIAERAGMACGPEGCSIADHRAKMGK
jgi:predicted DsbA family dithiol-disulfide isomerase